MVREDSLQQWLGELRAGDQQAAEKLWQQYFTRLVHLIDPRLPAFARREFDAEDVALSALDSLCRAATRDRLPALDDERNLWALLVGITHHKASHRIRRQMALKRGGGLVRGESVLGELGFARLLSESPTPEFACELAENSARLMDELPSEEVRTVARLAMDGHTSDEIATALGCARRTVTRRLALIRQIWSRHLVAGTQPSGDGEPA